MEQNMQKFLYLLMICSCCSAKFDGDVVKFVKNFFSHKHIELITLFPCSRQDGFRMFRYLSFHSKMRIISLDTMIQSEDALMRYTYYTHGIFIDCHCKENVAVLKQMSSALLFNSSYHWLAWGPRNASQQVSDDLSLNIDTEFTWSYRDEKTETIFLEDIYKINYTLPVKVTPAGYWNTSSGLRYNLTRYKFLRREDMEGARIRAGIVVNNLKYDDLKVDLVKVENRQLDAMATFNYGMFLLLQQQLNYTMELFPTDKFGFVIDEGNYDGLVKLIGDDEVDVGISSLMFITSRLPYVSYGSGYGWEFRICAIFRHPPVGGGADALAKPFSGDLWMATFFMWVVIAAFLRLVAWIQLKFEPQTGEQDPEDRHTWSDILVLVVGIVGEQGSVLDSRWLTWRFVFFMILLLTVLLNTYYAAMVVSTLLNQTPHNIKTATDLLHSQLQFGVEDIVYNKPFFEVNQDPLIKQFYRNKMLTSPHNKYYFSVEEGIRKVLAEEFAFHTEAIRAYPVIENLFPDHKKCALAEVLLFPVEMCYYSFPHNSPYKKILTYGIRKLNENGLWDHQNKAWRMQKPQCTSSTAEVISVDIQSLTVAFSLLVAGIIVSLCVLALEKMLFLRNKWKATETEIPHLLSTRLK